MGERYKLACFDLGRLSPDWERSVRGRRETALGELARAQRDKKNRGQLVLCASAVYVVLRLSADGEWVPLRDKEGRVIAY